jgi:asparagine synthase (glutamine-hydrolysing)
MSGIIPDQIKQRTDKLGFATPEYFWLNSIKDDLKVYFTPDLDKYFDSGKILKNWDKIFSGQPQSGFTNIWRFINFAIWKKVYNV